MWVVAGVALVQEIKVVERIAARACLLVEGPAMLAHQPTDHRHVDQAFQALELAQDQGAMGPGAGQRNVQVVTPGFGRETLWAACADPVSTLCVFALESAILAAFVPLVLPASIDQKAHRDFLGSIMRWRPV
ncbi:hypothetical protein D9M71_738700 [compost metagenome]